MNVPAAYLGVIVIWSTTPLAIRWSGAGVGFLFGALTRMLLGRFCVLLLCVARREFLRFDRAARSAYLAASVGIFPGMLCVYWGAQFVPSGWISVVFGLSPLVTAAFAAVTAATTASGRPGAAARLTARRGRPNCSPVRETASVMPSV